MRDLAARTNTRTCATCRKHRSAVGFTRSDLRTIANKYARFQTEHYRNQLLDAKARLRTAEERFDEHQSECEQ